MIKDEKFQRKWITISHFYPTKIELQDIDISLLLNPIDSFPPECNLNEEEWNTLQNLEKKEDGWSGSEFLKMRRLQIKRGLSIEGFSILSDTLQDIKIQAHSLGIDLPKWFLLFFETHRLLNRFRFDDIGFTLYHKIVPFPKNKNYYLIPFFGNSQGFCWWYLLINSLGEYCILYRDLHWEEKPEKDEPEELGEYYFCSSTFEEFLVRLSRDLIERTETTSNNELT